MKRVFLVTSHAGSVLSFRGELIRCLIESCCSVVVLAPNHTMQSRVELEALGASVGHFPMTRAGISPLKDLRSFIALWHIFASRKPNILVTFFVKPNIWGVLAAACAGARRRIAVVEGMGYIFTEGLNGKRSFKQIIAGWIVLFLYKVAFTVAHSVIVLNRDDLRELQRSRVVNPRKAVLLGGIGVRLDQWKLLPPHYSPITFTMVARLLIEKGIFDFLAAARVIKKKYPKTRFLLLGGLDDNPGSIQAAHLDPWIADGVVEWLGHADVLIWLAKTSVFVLPSYREGLPRSTQEAMAMGRPVITTDVPGCRETVVDGLNGFLVPPRNPDALVKAMENFIMNPNLILMMGRQSRRMAEERFDVHKVNAKMLEVLGI